jgi:hypothetical protein
MTETKTKAKHSQRLGLAMLIVSVVAVLMFVCSEKVRVAAKMSEPVALRTQTQTNAAANVKVAEQVYKNIQVFKGLPASDLEPTMAFISGSLGVKCNFCHVNPFDKDDRPTKQTARRMIRMVFDLNKGSFNGDKAVSCFTCHRGAPQPLSVPAVGQNLWQPTQPAEKETALPTADQILDKYVQALGGEPAFRKLTSRVAKGSRIGADGVLVPEDVYQKAPNKILTVVTYPKVAFSTGYNGTVGWGSSSQDGVRDLPAPVLAQLKTDAEFYKEIKTKELYRKFNVVGKTTIADSEVYIVDATPVDALPTGRPEKLYFDARTGLLLRRYLESELLLGMFPLQTDYSDYREVDGIKQPFLIRWSMPGRSWGRQIAEIKQNVPVDDAQFNAPQAKP